MSAGSQDYTVGAGRKPKEGLVLFEGVYVSVVPKADYDALAARLAEADAAVKRGDYWKAEHLAGNAKIDALAARLAEAERLLLHAKGVTPHPGGFFDAEVLRQRIDCFLAASDSALGVQK